MSAPDYSRNGALSSMRSSVCTCRWGGGADHGKYHVYLVGADRSFFTVFSLQCVMDDFGTLVVVDAP